MNDSVLAKKQVAAKLKILRLQKGFTQVSLAEKAGVNDNYYARVERADVSPTLERFEKIVKALDVKSSDILPF